MCIRDRAYTFRNSADGYKFLFTDGIYGEMAVFGPEELLNLSLIHISEPTRPY